MFYTRMPDHCQFHAASVRAFVVLYFQPKMYSIIESIHAIVLELKIYSLHQAVLPVALLALALIVLAAKWVNLCVSVTFFTLSFSYKN